MKPAVRATKNMWAERGAHVGALAGAIFHRVLVTPVSYVWKNLGIFVFMTLVFGSLGTCFAGLGWMIWNDYRNAKDVTPEYYQSVLAKPFGECVRYNVQNKNFTSTMTVGWLDRMYESCEELQRLDAQKKALNLP